jgi:uncharacterized protein YqhQ
MSDKSTPMPAAPLYGGQAVIEGVMMRGPRHFAVACRRADGTIAVTCEPVPKVLRPDWQKWPLLRGAFALVDSMALGTRALFWAAKVAEAGIAPAGEKSEIERAAETVGPAMGTAVAAPDPAANRERTPSRVTDVAIGGAMFTGLLIAVGLFKVLPILLVAFVQRQGWATATWQLGLIDAAVRFTIFFTYIGSVSRLAHVKRVFEYHGAEHKAINALEAHGTAGLDVPHAAEASRLHPRCGTSFIVIVLLLSVLAISPFYGLPLYWRLPLGVLMLFPVAGVAFELLRLAGKYRDNPVAAALSRPGMWTQLMTTREPDNGQLEVALASLAAVMDAEKAERREGSSRDADKAGPEVA